MSMIPQWFEKDLKIVDPTYYAIWNKYCNAFEIKKKLNLIDKDGYFHVLNPTVAVFKHLNDSALTEMRRRKWIANKFDDPKKHLKYLETQQKEAKEKKKELARQMITDGFYKIGTWGQKQIFDLGGKNG